MQYEVDHPMERPTICQLQRNKIPPQQETNKEYSEYEI